ncbi:uncharacterized protein LOC143038705 [Oratosquilla oratoria]|uniref:uncharacterized protein LOC143038705 n=1 Tax=Oratosquilla oratoria TaxID=337810 RepID=UPI003F75C3C4
MSYLNPAASIGHSSKRFPFGWVPNQLKADPPGNILHKPLTPLRLTLELCAMFPFKYNRQKGAYYLETCSIKFFYSGFMALWLTVLAVCNAIGIFRVANPPAGYEKYIHTNRETQLLGVAIISSCVANAFVEILNVVMVKDGFLELLNGWNQMSKTTGLRTTQGLRKAVMVYVSLLWAFSGTMFIMTLLGKPDIVNDIVSAFADVFLQVNEVWMLHPDSNWLATAAVRALVCAMILQVYIMYKATMFAFVSCCKIIRNGLREWRRRLRSVLNDFWKPEPEGDVDSSLQLCSLARDHHHLVIMIRKVELIFSPSLQCYYGSTLVTLCVQMYLLAYRMAQGEEYTADEAIWHSVLILQTVLMFFLVSLSASGIPEEIDASADVLRRGLPYDAPDRAKYHFSELMSAVTAGPPVAISGGKFFIISRPFIITVVGAVVSYFVIILQLNLPSASRGGGAPASSPCTPDATSMQSFNGSGVLNGTDESSNATIDEDLTFTETQTLLV